MFLHSSLNLVPNLITKNVNKFSSLMSREINGLFVYACKRPVSGKLISQLHVKPIMFSPR